MFSILFGLFKLSLSLFLFLDDSFDDCSIGIFSLEGADSGSFIQWKVVDSLEGVLIVVFIALFDLN